MNTEVAYLGLRLKHPLIASPSPLTKTLDGIRRLEDAGAAAVVLCSLFEEEIAYASQGRGFAHATDSPVPEAYLPKMDVYSLGPDEYGALIQQARQAVQIPVIASLNGITRGGWTSFARLIQEAGAHALELNIYSIPSDPAVPACEIENLCVELLRDVRAAVDIPVAVKLLPFYTSLAHLAARLCAAGARGLVLFNRFYQPDVDLDRLEMTPHLMLSSSEDLRLPLRWTAMLHGRVEADLALSGGVHTGHDALKAVLAGANAVMVASELLQRGVRRLRDILGEMTRWMEDRRHASFDSVRGLLSERLIESPSLYERANYLRVLDSYHQDPPGLSL